MRLLIVIVNYRTADLTIDCLSSLAPEIPTVPGTQVIVVDSASGDDSPSRLARTIAAQGWDSWVSLIPLETNRGFAAGNNAAIDCALARPDRPDYFFLLNPDTVVLPGALRTLVEFMDQHPQAGLAGPRVEFADGRAQSSAFRFPTVLSELEGSVRVGVCTRLLGRWMVAPPPRPQAHRSDWVSACAMIVRRQLFEQLGTFDENYFMYYEEVDFCLRVGAAGWQRWYVPSARIVHHVGQASGVTDHRRRQPGYWFDSRQHFYCKNHGRLYALLANLTFVVGFASWRLRRRLLRIPDFDPPHMLWDFIRHTAACTVRGRPGEPPRSALA
jgi:GT2 family glycosyltransferase